MTSPDPIGLPRAGRRAVFPRAWRHATLLLLPTATALFAIAIFIVDANTPEEIALSVLYVVVVLMATRFCQARGVLLVSVGCAGLTVLAFFVAPSGSSGSVGIINTSIGILANGLTTFLVLQGQSAEAALREQASLLDLTHDTVFSRGMDDAITYWNRGAEETYGWSREDAVGKTSHQLLQTTFPEPLERIMEHLLRTGRWGGKLIHTRRDATRITVDSRWSLQRDGQGRPAVILETNNDITERKRAEEVLRESEKRYRNIFETAAVSIWEEDFSRVKAATDELKAQGVRDFRAYLAAHPDFVRQAIAMVKVLDINNATVKLFKARSKGELLGSLHAIFTPETEEAFAEELIAVAQGLTSFASEATVRTLDGDNLTVLFTMTFPPHPAELDRVLVTLTDITARKRAEVLTSQVFGSSPDGIAIVGKDYRYRRVNPVYERNWRIPAERILGMPVADLLGTEVFTRAIKPELDRCFAGEEVTYAAWFTTARGRCYFAITYSPLRLDSEHVEAALVITRDLTSTCWPPKPCARRRRSLRTSTA